MKEYLDKCMKIIKHPSSIFILVTIVCIFESMVAYRSGIIHWQDEYIDLKEKCEGRVILVEQKNAISLRCIAGLSGEQ